MTVWKFLESVLVSTSPCIEPVKPHVEPCVRAEGPFLGADIKTSDNFCPTYNGWARNWGPWTMRTMRMKRSNKLDEKKFKLDKGTHHPCFCLPGTCIFVISLFSHTFTPTFWWLLLVRAAVTSPRLGDFFVCSNLSSLSHLLVIFVIRWIWGQFLLPWSLELTSAFTSPLLNFDVLSHLHF